MRVGMAATGLLLGLAGAWGARAAPASAGQPVATGPTQQPVATGPTRQPVAAGPTQQPAAAGPTQQPAATDAFAQPVKDCQPCRFSPGKGQPEFDLRFVFEGSGDDRALVALDLTPVGGGKAQRLDVGTLAVADFADGFTLDTTDMNFDGLRDLSIVTVTSADNIDVTYWIYQPASHDFVPLERVNDGDDNEVALFPIDHHMLSCHVKDNAVYATDYLYRVSGHRAVAVHKEAREQDGPLIVDSIYDLSVTPARLLHRVTLGFAADSPERDAFVHALETASQRASALYRHGDAAAAADAITPVVGDKDLALVTSSYPVQGDPGDAALVREFNDYGFYLAQAKRTQQAIEVLSAVTDVDPARTVAYLNLADAEYAAGQAADARAHYAEYAKRMAAAGNQAAMPPRVAERMR
jgi:hypothetical protein